MIRYTGHLLCAGVLLLGLGACAGKSTVWDNEQANRQNSVELLRIPHDIRFAGEMTALTAEEKYRLDSFLATIRPTAHDVIALDAPDGANSRLDAGRIATIRSHLAASGYKLAPTITPSGESPAANNLRLVVERASVRGPDCPDWSRKAAPNYENAPTSNMGCATESALGLMVANPRDLVAPASYEPANAENAAKAAQALRNDKVKWPEKMSRSITGGK